MKLWMNALKDKNLAGVVKIYNDNVVFLPTISGDFHNGHAGVRSYFKHFLPKSPEVKLIEERLQIIPERDDFYIHSGMYNFKIDNDQKDRVAVKARFTFIWQKTGKDTWQIIHHHSSRKPE